MKKLFIIFIFLIPWSLYAEKNIIVYQGDKKLGEMTPKQFGMLIVASQAFLAIEKAEKHDRVKIIVPRNWHVPPKEKTIVPMTIIWLDKNNIILKEIKIKGTIQMVDPKSMGFWDTIYGWYEKIVIYALPATIIIIIILV